MSVCPKLLFFLALVSGIASGDEPDTCKPLSYSLTQLSQQASDSNTAHCQSSPIRNLYINRAYHHDLLRRFSHYDHLEYWPGQTNNTEQYALKAHQTFIRMVEVFASTRLPDTDATATYLNAVYDKAFEIAELRLKGSELRAKWIERHEGFARISYNRP